MINYKISQKAVILISIIMLLGGCVFISSGNKIKLDRYPEIKQETLKELSLSYELIGFNKEGKESKRYMQFLPLNVYGKKKLEVIKEFKKDPDTKCTVRVSGKIREIHTGKIKDIYRNISGIALEIIPFFWINPNQAKSQLIYNKDNKILKEYSLKENLYELRSFFLVIPALFYPPWWDNTDNFTMVDWGGSQQSRMYRAHQGKIRHKLSEALTRKIVSDAASFKECLK